MKSRCDGMAPNGDCPLNGKQVTLLADGICRAFVGFDDLAKVVLPALDVRLSDVVGNPPFPSQVLQLVQWTEAKGKTKDLARAAVKAVPANPHLREAVGAVFGEAALGGPVGQPPSLQPTDYAARIQNFLTEYLGTPERPVPFGGRDDALARIDAWLDNPRASPYRLLAAPAGRGKSALLVRWVQRLRARRSQSA
jgi:hypothetical protein